MVFSGKKIKAPGEGLLALHPFVDVLEGRDLFTATAHDGLLSVATVVHHPTAAVQPPWATWGQTAISVDGVAQDGVFRDDAACDAEEPDETVLLARHTTPGEYELRPETSTAVFGAKTIGDGAWSLFGNALHDRRSTWTAKPLPTDEQIAIARAKLAPDDTPFGTGRALTGAMRPFLTMRVEHDEFVEGQEALPPLPGPAPAQAA